MLASHSQSAYICNIFINEERFKGTNFKSINNNLWQKQKKKQRSSSRRIRN